MGVPTRIIPILILILIPFFLCGKEAKNKAEEEKGIERLLMNYEEEEPNLRARLLNNPQKTSGNRSSGFPPFVNVQ